MTSFRFSLAKYAAAGTLALFVHVAHADPVLRFDAPAQVDVGDSFVMLLHGSGFDFTSGGLPINNVSGGQKLNLSFTAGVLEIVGITIDPRWTFAAANKPGVVDNAVGTLTGMAFGVFPATVDPAFNIARITFRALQAAPADVVITTVDLAGTVNNLPGVRILSSYLPSAVQVSAVPEPQGWAMLAAGICWVAFRLRRA